MLRYKLRTLLILLAILPPLLWVGWTKYEAWRVERERRRGEREARQQPLFQFVSGPEAVLKSLGPPPPGLRWVIVGEGVGAVPVTVPDKPRE